MLAQREEAAEPRPFTRERAPNRRRMAENEKMGMSLDALIKAQRAERIRASKKEQRGADGEGSAKLAKSALVAAVGARSKAQRAAKLAKARGMEIDSVPVPVVAPRTKGRGSRVGGKAREDGSGNKKKKKKKSGAKGPKPLAALKGQLQTAKNTAAASKAALPQLVASPQSVKVIIPGAGASPAAQQKAKLMPVSKKVVVKKGGNPSMPGATRGIGKKKKPKRLAGLAHVMSKSGSSSENQGITKGNRGKGGRGKRVGEGRSQGAGKSTKAKYRSLSARFSS